MYIGKIRFFVNVLDDNQFELLEYDIFHDEFISCEYCPCEINNDFESDINQISEKIFEKENIEPSNVFEIVADLFWKEDKTYCFEYNVYEYDCYCWVEKEKYNKLTEEQIKNKIWEY
jgi:hypothetical protein